MTLHPIDNIRGVANANQLFADESLKLEEWINPDYFKPEMRIKINKTFARNNSINLHVRPQDINIILEYNKVSY